MVSECGLVDLGFVGESVHLGKVERDYIMGAIETG